MNLSRREKLDRESKARGGSRKAPAAVADPEPVPPPAPLPEAEPPAPTPVAATERPKQPRFVRPAAEKRAATSPTTQSPPTTSLAGKVMSRNLTVAPKGAAGGANGPQASRGPIANTKKSPAGRRK